MSIPSYPCTCCCSAYEDEAVYQGCKKCNEEDWQNLVTEVRGLTLLHTVLMLNKLIYKLGEPQGVAEAYEEEKEDHSHRERPHSGIQGVCRLLKFFRWTDWFYVLRISVSWSENVGQ